MMPAYLTRTVRLQNGHNVVFTQRGKNPQDGFVRYNGKTITGFRIRDQFYGWRFGKNYQLTQPTQARVA